MYAKFGEAQLMSLGVVIGQISGSPLTCAVDTVCVITLYYLLQHED